MLATTAVFAADEPAATSAFVRVKGTEFVDPHGEVLRLRGINLGNWLLPEGYMFHFERAASPRQIEDVVAELVGDVAAAQFWREWRENYVTRDDIALIRRVGFNSVRVPLNWRLFVSANAPFRMEGPGWELLDRVIGWCREEKIYVVIDLHAAPDGQTGANIDDSRGRPLLFDDPEAQQLTIELWKTIAARYRGERWVLGYDLLNEPIAHYFDTRRLNPLLGEFYRRLVPEVRTIDPNHILFLGGAQWNTQFDPLGPPPAPNVAYTFHLYWDQPSETSIKRYLDWRDKYDVPMWLGETGENTDEWIAKFRAVLEQKRIGWCFWPYKKMDATTCAASVAQPDDWRAIVAYAEASRGDVKKLQGALPSLETSRRALAQLLENIRLANCRINPGYLRALGLSAPNPGP
ncbi:MAG TPA: cellulase family glycosylhydrolase [Opitutus sp.]|nr:cellulase family glycosylhydrolase [Opitutus sp.]